MGPQGRKEVGSQLFNVTAAGLLFDPFQIPKTWPLFLTSLCCIALLPSSLFGTIVTPATLALFSISAKSRSTWTAKVTDVTFFCFWFPRKYRWERSSKSSYPMNNSLK